MYVVVMNARVIIAPTSFCGVGAMAALCVHSFHIYFICGGGYENECKRSFCISGSIKLNKFDALKYFLFLYFKRINLKKKINDIHL